MADLKALRDRCVAAQKRAAKYRQKQLRDLDPNDPDEAGLHAAWSKADPSRQAVAITSAEAKALFEGFKGDADDEIFVVLKNGHRRAVKHLAAKEDAWCACHVLHLLDAKAAAKPAKAAT